MGLELEHCTTKDTKSTKAKRGRTGGPAGRPLSGDGARGSVTDPIPCLVCSSFRLRRIRGEFRQRFFVFHLPDTTRSVGNCFSAMLISMPLASVSPDWRDSLPVFRSTIV